MTSNIVAKPVVKNKCWIVEDHGHKTGTILAVDEVGGVVLVEGDRRTLFPSIAVLASNRNIRVDRALKPQRVEINEVQGYPVDCRPYNAVMDVVRGLPIYSKRKNSRSFYCAGYYVIYNRQGRATLEFCPKLLTVSRNRYQGPFKDQVTAESKLM